MAKPETKRDKEALSLLADPSFWYRAGQKIGEYGVVGEKTNRLLVYAAALSASLSESERLSIVIKGSSSSGKSQIIKSALQLIPPEDVFTLSSLSAQAPVHGKLAQYPILHIQEYRGSHDGRNGKTAQYLLRLMQSEGMIAHESATVNGRQRGSAISRKIASPVILTTTTDERLFRDDETRFLAPRSNESPEQTRAVLKQRLRPRLPKVEASADTWHQAWRLLRTKEFVVNYPQEPSWLSYVADFVPTGNVRVRRDWNKLLALCAVMGLPRALSSSPKERQIALEVMFSDYCAAFHLLDEVLLAEPPTLDTPLYIRA